MMIANVKNTVYESNIKKKYVILLKSMGLLTSSVLNNTKGEKLRSKR